MKAARRSVGSIVRAIGDRVGVPDEHPSFTQGLAMGALVGAAIAGSSLWSRWRARPTVGAGEKGEDPTRN